MKADEARADRIDELAELVQFEIQTGYPSGLPPLLDMNEEQQEAVDLAVSRINKQREQQRERARRRRR